MTNRDGLELTLPSRTITLAEINDLIGRRDRIGFLRQKKVPSRLGPGRYIDIIDCEKQVTYKMALEEYVDYFESIDRSKIYNVLSLEISNTKYVQ